MVSTSDSDSGNPSSIPGTTFLFLHFFRSASSIITPLYLFLSFFRMTFYKSILMLPMQSLVWRRLHVYVGLFHLFDKSMKL
jgi:hypothetical protein